MTDPTQNAMCKSMAALVSRAGGADTRAMQSGLHRAFFALAWLLLLATGCRPAQPAPPQRPAVTINGASGVDTAFNGSVDTDACAARLQNIEGEFYQYYITNHRFPDRLAELAQYVDFDQVPDYTCPLSHQPYTYLPNGMESPKMPGKLIVFDSAPVHHTVSEPARWGIVVRPPSGKRFQTMTMDVVPIPESLFRTFRPIPAAPQLPATAPARINESH